MPNRYRLDELLSQCDPEAPSPEEAQSKLSKLEEKKGFVEQYFPEDSEHQALIEIVEKAEKAHRDYSDLLPCAFVERFPLYLGYRCQGSGGAAVAKRQE